MKHPLITTALLACALLAAIIAMVGVLRAGNVFARIHFLSALSIAPVALFAAAAALELPFLKGGLKTLIIAGLLIIQGPIVAHVIGRTARRLRAPEEP